MMEQKVGSVCNGLPPLCAKYPWLVSEEEGTRDQIFYTIRNNPLLQYKCRTPELLGNHIRGCFFGWLILSDDNAVTWSLWNPSTSKIICLPPLTNIFNIKGGHCCLSAPPEDPNSVILITRPEKPTFVLCRVHGKRKKFRWKEMSYVEQLKRVTGNGTLVYGLACCNGKVYALSTDNSFVNMVLQVDIKVKDREVVVKLWLLGACPSPFTPSANSLYANHYLKGFGSELFCVIVAFCEETKVTMGSVSLFKLDMTSIDWKDIQGCLRSWDIRDMDLDGIEAEDVKHLGIIGSKWEEVLDLKDAIFFVDLARDFSVYYTRGISSELGGYIHIRGEMGKIIHSYCLNDRTISLRSMPCHVLPTSHVSLWECRFEGDHHTDLKQEKPNKGDEIVAVRVGGRNEDEFTKSPLLDLPPHVLELVMEACVGVEYLNFRTTCKSCHLASPFIEWKSDPTSLKRLQNYSVSSPWLMVVYEIENYGFVTFQDPNSGEEYVMTKVESNIFRGRISCSRFGWLLCYYDQFTPTLHNYFTGDAYILPDLDYCYGSMCFSAPPTCRDCMVVAFSRKRKSVFVHFLYRERTWREVDLDIEHSFYFPTFFGSGLIYALSENGELYVFKDLDKQDNYSWEQVVGPTSRRGQRFITKCDEHLLLVVVGVSGESVEVFKLNDSRKEWEKIDSLGRHMVYISSDSCICIEAKSAHMENKIYFPQMNSKRNGSVVFYSLETCSYATFKNKNIEDTSIRLSYEFYPHAWIEPSWLEV